MGNSIYGGNLFSQSWTWNVLDGYNLLPMGADPKYTTVSGYSSGAEMTNTLLIAHSETFKGAGIQDGIPYGVAVQHPDYCMFSGDNPDKFPATCFDAEVIGN